MKCNLVILNYNDAIRALELALKCINFQSINKVIIVNNGSTDNSLVYLRENLKDNEDIILLNSEINGGFAFGNNLGAKYIAKHLPIEYILFTNTDTIYTNECVEKCINYLNNYKNLALISPRIKDMKNNEEISCWEKRNYFDYLLSNFYFYRTHITPPLKGISIKSNGIQFVEHVRGSYMLFRLESLEEIDFFDENTFLYFEEEIISEKLKKRGYKIGVLVDEFYVHNHIASQNAENAHDFFYESLYYYLNTYCHVGKIRLFILKLAVKFKDFEMTYIIYPLKKIKKRIFNHTN